MRRLYFILFLLASIPEAYSQIAWEILFDDTTDVYSQKIVQCPDGNFVVAANIKRDDGWKIFLEKISNSGSMIWSKTYDKELGKIFGLMTTNSGNLLAVYDSYDITGYEIFKLSGDGDSLWTKPYGTSAGVNTYAGIKAMINDKGFIYMFGSVEGIDPFNNYFSGPSIQKFDTNANFITFNPEGYYSTCGAGSESMYADAFSTNKEDQFCFTFFRPFLPCIPAAVVEMCNAEGDTLFSYAKIGDNTFGQVLIDDDGGCSLLQYSYTSTSSFLKISAAGELAWSMEVPWNVYNPKLIRSPDGNVVLAKSGIELRKIKVYEGTQWVTNLNPDEFTTLSDIAVTADSGYIISGYRTDLSTGFNHLYVAKTKEDKLLSVPGQTGNQDLGIELFPNPSSDEFFIQLQSNTSGKLPQLKLFNYLGQEVTSLSTIQSTNTSISVSTSGLSAGLFMVQVYLDNKLSGVAKWEKSR